MCALFSVLVRQTLDQSQYGWSLWWFRYTFFIHLGCSIEQTRDHTRERWDYGDMYLQNLLKTQYIICSWVYSSHLLQFSRPTLRRRSAWLCQTQSVKSDDSHNRRSWKKLCCYRLRLLRLLTLRIISLPMRRQSVWLCHGTRPERSTGVAAPDVCTSVATWLYIACQSSIKRMNNIFPLPTHNVWRASKLSKIPASNMVIALTSSRLNKYTEIHSAYTYLKFTEGAMETDCKRRPKRVRVLRRLQFALPLG